MNIVTPIVEFFGKNWQPLRSDVSFGQGHLWKKINCSDRRSCEEQYYNGLTFTSESPRTSLVKTAGLALCGSFFFAGATVYHGARTVKATLDTFKDLYASYQDAVRQADSSVDGGLSGFIKGQDPSRWENCTNTLYKMAKSYACWVPFAILPLPCVVQPQTWVFASLHPVGWLTGTELGFYAGLGFIAYSIYDPRYPKVLLHELEQWIVEPVASAGESVSSKFKIQDEDKPDLSILDRIQDLFEFKVTMSYYLNWERCASHSSEKED